MNHIQLITTLLLTTSICTLSGTQLPDPNQDSIYEIAQWMLEKPITTTKHFLNYYNDLNLENSIKEYLLATYQTQLQDMWPQLAQRITLQYMGKCAANCNYHTGITNAAVDTTASYVIASYWNNATLWWDLKAQQYQQLPLGNAISTAAAFHPNDSQWAITTLNDGKTYWLNHWDLSSFGVQQCFKANNRCINAVIYTADNVVFSGGDDKQVFQKNLNNYDNATCIIKDTKAKVKKMAFSPKLQLIATGGDDAKVRVWHTDGRSHNELDCSNMFIYYMPSTIINGSTKHAVPYHAPDSPGITSLVFDPTGTILYVAFEYDTSWGAILWDVMQNTVQDVAAWDTVYSYPGTFSPHGNCILTYIGAYNNCELRAYGLSNGHQQYFPAGDNRKITYLFCSADSKYVYGMDPSGNLYYWKTVLNTEAHFSVEQLSLERLITIIKQNNI